ncbi:hypothetical protein N7492_002319 [Penicillium capsulatum]|uniref:Uncharacterized protein n=1 Tax=Penicillium capsulatum TaxID=69766 RepID=A0A9W9LVX3_9EURO|nr:hypothetical protein N7492_002319 [Penicillium capsulatum]
MRRWADLDTAIGTRAITKNNMAHCKTRTINLNSMAGHSRSGRKHHPIPDRYTAVRVTRQTHTIHIRNMAHHSRGRTIHRLPFKYTTRRRRMRNNKANPMAHSNHLSSHCSSPAGLGLA